MVSLVDDTGCAALPYIAHIASSSPNSSPGLAWTAQSTKRIGLSDSSYERQVPLDFALSLLSYSLVPVMAGRYCQ